VAGLQQVFVYRSRRSAEVRRAALATRDEKQRQELPEELRRTLQREDYLRTELDGIARFLRDPHPRMDMRGLANATSQMAEHAIRQ
jgi:hypothetical protein